MLAIRRCLFGSSKGGKHDKHKYNDIPSIPKEVFHLNISTDPLHAPPKNAQPQPEPALEDGDELEMEARPPVVEEARPDETTVEEAGHDETIVIEARFDEILVKEAPIEKIIVEEVRPEKTVVEEAQPDETLEELAPLYKLLLEEPQESKLNQIFHDLIGPYKCPEELGDLSNNLGLHDPDCSSLNMCTEILGSESCDNMVKDMNEAVTEWTWNHKRQRKKAIDAQMLVNRGLPPPIPRYIGRPCRFMKVTRCNGRITMNEVVMDRQPETMQIERDNGEIKMQLMTYVGDAGNDDAEASTSAFYFGDVLKDDADASTSALYVGDARKDDAEASTAAMNVGDDQVSTLALYVRDAWNDNDGTSTSGLYIGDAQKDDVEASTSAMNVGDAQASTLALYVGDAKNDDAEASALAFYVGDAKSDDAEASTSGSTSKQVVEACEETILEEEEEEEEEETTDKLDSRKKGKKVAAKAA